MGRVILLLAWLGVGLRPGEVGAQGQPEAVAVTARFDTNRVVVGGATVLRVYAQVVPSVRAEADRIFSWYLDLLNQGPGVGIADYAQLVKPTSDNQPGVSSAGFDDASHRRGIYDTFLQRARAGVNEPVELFRVPVRGVAAGRIRFLAAPGSGVVGLSSDFIVAPSVGGTVWTGGAYGAAGAELEVVADGCPARLGIGPETPGAGLGLNRRLTLQFSPCEGFDHFVEARTFVFGVGLWETLSGGPHNTGSVTVTNAGGGRVFRVRTVRRPRSGRKGARRRTSNRGR